MAASNKTPPPSLPSPQSIKVNPLESSSPTSVVNISDGQQIQTIAIIQNASTSTIQISSNNKTQSQQQQHQYQQTCGRDISSTGGVMTG